MKKTKNKLLKISLGSLVLFSSLSSMIFLNEENKIVKSISKTLNFKDNHQQIQELKMSKNIGYPIFTIHKTGHDAERINFLLIGEGYNENDQNKFFDAIKSIGSNLMLREPFKQFSQFMNFYAIFTYKDKDNNNFLDTFLSSTGIFGLSQKGRTRLENLINTFENSFLEEGGKVADISIVNATPGRAVASKWTETYNHDPREWLNLIQGDNASNYQSNTYIHETGHSFANLADEYAEGGGSENWPNRASSFEVAKNKWDQFIGFKNIEPTYLKKGVYVPSNQCMMKLASGIFCEVCAYYLFLRLNSSIPKHQKDIYLASSSISLEHSSASQYVELDLDSNNPLSIALNKKIDFSTIVHNFRTTSRKIKLKMWIEDKSTKAIKKTWEKEFNIQPNELKRITILTEEITNDLANDKNTIHGQVIDASTNKVLDSRKSYTSRFYDYGEVKFNFKLFNNGKIETRILPIIGEYKFSVENNTKYKITPPILKGYKFKTSDKPNLELEIKNTNSNLISPTLHEVTLYYEKLQSKKFKIQLKDESGNIVEEKEQIIYENETFIPDVYDFFVTQSNNNNFVDYRKSIPELDKRSYSEITEGEVITYNIVPDPAPMYEQSEVILDYGGIWNKDIYTYNYSYDWQLQKWNTQSIGGDAIDTNAPGIYYLTYISDSQRINYDNVRIVGIRHRTLKVIVKNQDGSLPDESSNDIQLKNEKARIDNKYFYFKKWKYTNQEINELNEENIFTKYIYGMVKKDGFNYKVVNLDKSEINKIKFNIEITKNLKNQKLTTLSRQVFLYYKNIDTAQNLELEELQNERIKVDNLIISFKKSKYTQEEINGFNEQTIKDELNNWPYSSDPQFQFEIVDLKNDSANKKFTFKIKITKVGQSLESKLFEVSYKVIQSSEQITAELQKEKTRVDSLYLGLKKEKYTQQEIDSFDKQSIINEINNWPSSVDFKYEILELKNDSVNKKFTFTIKITKESQSVNSRTFELSYVIQTIEQLELELNNEKTRVDSLELGLKNHEYTQEQIDQVTSSSLMNELSNFNPSLEYKYEIINLIKNSENKTISFKIKISKSGKEVESKEFSLTYKLSSGDNNNNSNSNKEKSNDNLQVILLGTLIPTSLAIAGAVGFVIYKKRKNN